MLALLAPGDGWAMKRFALLVGANTGWDQDRPLRYAEQDAHSLGAVLQELGGFSSEALAFLDTPTTERLLAELDAVQQRLREASGEETLFVFYFSGHADAKHLHLPGAALSFEELYRRLRELRSTVTLGIFDACQSGSILQAKGARQRIPEFNVILQGESEVRGTVLLTSSGADELSQEARALSGSFFTQHLVSGLRGAADDDGDQWISLEEAYRHAAIRTQLDTAGTAAGAQRPGFRYELKGRGQLFLTRLEGPVGFLRFPPASPRCFVTDPDERRLFAEIVPRQTADQRLGVSPGKYRLKCVHGDKYRVAALELKAGEERKLSQLAFHDAPLSQGVLKGAGRRLDLAEVLAHRLVAKSELFRTERPDQPELSALLSVASLQLAPSLEAQQVLRLGMERLARAGVCLKHPGSVLDVTWSPDGQRMATSGADGRVRLWEPNSGAEQSHLKHPGPVTQLAWSRDGQLLSARQARGESFLWGRSQGDGFVRQLPSLALRAVAFDPAGTHLALIDRSENLSLLTGHRGDSLLRVGANSALASFSADGRLLASFDIFGRARVWEVSTGRLALAVEPETPLARASTLALSPDGRLLALVSQDAQAVRLWDVTAARQLALVRHEGAITGAVFTPEGLLITASEDQTVRVWEVTSGRERARLHHDAAVKSLALSPDGRWLATTRRGGRSALLWNLETGREAARLPQGGEVNTVAWNLRGDRLATASADGTACTWGLPSVTNSRLSTWGRYTGLAFSPNGEVLFTATEAEPVQAWDVSSGRELPRLTQVGGTHHLALSPDGTWLAAAHGSRVSVWEARSGRALAHMEHEGFIHALAFSPEGPWIASASQDGAVLVWEATTGQVRMRGPHPSAVRAVAFSPDGHRLATGSEDRTARIWEVATGRELTRWEHPATSLRGTASKVDFVQFSPDGHTLATTTLDAVARLWDTRSERELLRVQAPEFIRALAFSPDSRTLAIASGESVARLWSVATGQELSHIATEEDVSFLQYSADGSALMTSSAAGTIRLWEPSSGRELARLQEETSPETVLLSPDGRYVATAREDSETGYLSYSLHVWRPEDLIAQACARLQRNLSRTEWRQHVGNGEPYRKLCPSLPSSEK